MGRRTESPAQRAAFIAPGPEKFTGSQLGYIARAVTPETRLVPPSSVLIPKTKTGQHCDGECSVLFIRATSAGGTYKTPHISCHRRGLVPAPLLCLLPALLFHHPSEDLNSDDVPPPHCLTSPASWSRAGSVLCNVFPYHFPVPKCLLSLFFSPTREC